MLIQLLVCSLLLNSVFSAREGFGPGLQDWGHETVREGAHMFWWLYYTTADVPSHFDRPLAIWLQGGPGASSTGYGNFEELGPLDLDLNPRNHTWVKDMNVIFIDNPVGTGFSYVDSNSYLTRTNKEIAIDLVALMRNFYEKIPEFKTVPLHIFSESYGGKMAVDFALLLDSEIKSGNIESNLQSVNLIDSWISPIDSVLSWAPFLLNMGIVDQDGYNRVHASALLTQDAVDAGNGQLATSRWGQTENVILDVTHGVDFYNVLTETRYSSAKRMTPRDSDPLAQLYRKNVLFDDDTFSLNDLMRDQVAPALDMPSHVNFGSQSNAVFSYLNEDFMWPVTDVVETLLNTTSVEVVVITGQLDLIVATPGTINWVDRLQWAGLAGYKAANRNGVGVNGILEGYQKKYGKFSVYWVNRSGHMVPADNPAAMSYILRAVTNFG